MLGKVFFNEPLYESLYIKLESSDFNQISRALSEANIGFRPGNDGSSIMVPSDMINKARLLLASHGLPSNSSSGYELFDKVNSFGLTSFMQEITRVRALEGEIARTIQSISGITAARVHIVMSNTGNFRYTHAKPTASVMIRASSSVIHKSASAIRYLVASAVPGLDVSGVTVLDSTGQLLLSGDDTDKNKFTHSFNIIQSVQHEIGINIDKALAPFLGIGNFRSTVIAELNTDTQKIQETIYDPDSRVERSVHVSKNIQKVETHPQDSAVTVEQNIPHTSEDHAAGTHSTEHSDKKEEQSNYEINTKNISTVHSGYKLERLSIAVVINNKRLIEILGKEIDRTQIDSYIDNIRQVVSSASGLNVNRGDVVTITPMDFIEDQLLNETSTEIKIIDILSQHFTTIIHYTVFLIIVFLIIWFAIRPLVQALNKNNHPGFSSDTILSVPTKVSSDILEGADAIEKVRSSRDDFSVKGNNNPNDDIKGNIKEGPGYRLSYMVDLNEERFAKILRKWVRSETDSLKYDSLNQS
ncbi:Flagellar M-ring protein FliF [Liberibacter crescens BT-1]|uniref:Flagellar M-ring protein n=1 Tax=Liberibacter crescens (strain BT-1) TaxID=1215343 RepID=L0EUW0_LIBCB|nr:Flagellar M-ring protein FliF [Liberibacter crescens BT-1]